jgi:hypothetical protein
VRYFQFILTVFICTIPSKSTHPITQPPTHLPTPPTFHQPTQVVSRARVPVVKANERVHPLGVSFDVVVNNDIALRNSSLLATYAAVDERARALVFLVKAWAKVSE